MPSVRTLRLPRRLLTLLVGGLLVGHLTAAGHIVAVHHPVRAAHVHRLHRGPPRPVQASYHSATTPGAVPPCASRAGCCLQGTWPCACIYLLACPNTRAPPQIRAYVCGSWTPT